MQDDGNLVLYDSQGGAALWASQQGRLQQAAANAAPPPAPTPAIASPTPTPVSFAQALGLTVLGSQINDGTLTANQALVSANGRYTAVMQTDGNFVVYDGTRAIWASGTDGKANGGFLAMQGDGNLVVYAPGGNAKWASGTNGAGVNRQFTLVMQDDGNLVVYDSQGGAALWSSQTDRIAAAAA
jgi:exopolysaccharide biosynthesis protein